MIDLMRPAIDFLNQLKIKKGEEADSDEEQPIEDAGPLETTILEASTTKLADLGADDTLTTFKGPEPKPIPPKPSIANILYKKPKDQVERVKARLGVTSNKAVGEETFDYYYEAECTD